MSAIVDTTEEHHPRSSERCYQILRKMLTCMQIPPGTRLREVEWSERLGIQRAALREAMVLLVHDGLLMRRSSGGFFTPRLEEINTDHMVDARAVLELGALKVTCARQLDESAFFEVEKVCEMMQKCHEAGLTTGFCEADFLFHQKLLELSGNPTLIQMFSHSAQLIFALAPISEQRRMESQEKTIAEHRKILNLIKKNQLAEATELLEKHLLGTKLSLKSCLP